MNLCWSHMDPELARRAQTILVKLKLLGEASSTSIVAFDGNRTHGTKAPSGARDRDNAKPPPKDRSLYDWYLWHFTRAATDDKRRLLCFLAERDYEKYRRRSPQPRSDEGAEGEVAGMKRIVEWYEGLSTLEVAILEDCSAGFVEKARRVHRRDPEDGFVRDGWQGWDEEKRTAEVTKLKQRKVGQREAARRLETSPSTMNRYWKKVAA